MPTVYTNGIDMHYLERGEPENPALFMMHAATVQGGALAWATRWASRYGFFTVAPDVRGHGQTPNPAPDLHMPRLVEDYVGFLQHFDERLPAHAFGYSMGGGITLYTALRHPEWFRSIVLLGSNYQPASIERTDRVVGPVAQRSDIERRVFDPNSGIRVGWDGDLEELGQRLTMPVLMVIGDNDEFLDVGGLLPLYNALPNADLLVVPHCSHLRLVNHPIVIKAMERFYGRIGR